MVIHTMAIEHHKLVKGTTQQGKRLASLGISTHLALLPWQPYLNEVARDRLAQEVLRSQYRLSQAKASQAITEHHKLATRQAQLKGRTRWSATIKPLHQGLYNISYHANTSHPKQSIQPTTTTTPTSHKGEHHGHQGSRAKGGPPPSSVGVAQGLDIPTSTHGPSSSTSPSDFSSPLDAPMAPLPPPSIIYLQCPRCTHQLPGTKAAFDTHNLDSRVWCNSCQQSLFVRQWRCRCGLPWHTCPTHQGEPARLRATQAMHQDTATSSRGSTRPNKTRAKRALGQGRDTAILQWLDQPPQKKRCTVAQDIELEDSSHSNRAKRAKPYLMGPKLQAKFPRIRAEPPSPAHSITTEQMTSWTSAGLSRKSDG